MKYNSALENILRAREERDALEKKLLFENKADTMITVRANYPGSEKNTVQSHIISYFTFLQVIKNFSHIKIFYSLTSEGLLFFILTHEKPIAVKQKTVEIEENFFLGRLADIDVRNKTKIFSRSDLGKSERKCLLCNQRAVLCVRNKTHPLDSVIQKINCDAEKIFTSAVNNTNVLARIVRVSMLEELCRVYSFGCVNVNHNGSHSDMNFLLMLKGIDVVAESIAALNAEKVQSFYHTRQHGIVFEKKLLAACGGVNTYKGAHFLFLILCAGALNCKNFSQLQNFIAEFSKGCRADFTIANSELNFEMIGARGAALSGFEKHFHIYLPLIEAGVSATELTLTILANTYDTTTVKRAGKTQLAYIQEQARAVKTETEIQKLDRYCVEHNLSTGGVADNFIISYALYLIKKYYYGL